MISTPYGCCWTGWAREVGRLVLASDSVGSSLSAMRKPKERWLGNALIALGVAQAGIALSFALSPGDNILASAVFGLMAVLIAGGIYVMWLGVALRGPSWVLTKRDGQVRFVTRFPGKRDHRGPLAELRLQTSEVAGKAEIRCGLPDTPDIWGVDLKRLTADELALIEEFLTSG